MTTKPEPTEHLEDLLGRAMAYEDHHGTPAEVLFTRVWRAERQCWMAYCQIITGHTGESEGYGADYMEAFGIALAHITGRRAEDRRRHV